MFSSSKKYRKQAADYAEMAGKIINYRKDVLEKEALSELDAVFQSAKSMSGDRSLSGEKLTEKTTGWESVLRKHGGKIYPKTFWSDNLETFMVAAIVVLGIRAFFLQPFIIPTNSMYPTYSGMYHEIYKGDEMPSVVSKPFRFLLFGARNQDVIAESDGPVRIPLLYNESSSGEVQAKAAFEVVDGRKWLFVPTKLKRYPIFVGETPVGFEVPLDFNADSLLLDRFFPDSDSWAEVIEQNRTSGRFRRQSSNRGWIEVAGERVASGDTVLNFDILSGDALFVDRFTYHFFPPKVGDPIVFRTGSIDYPRQPLGEKYYIKRLAGAGGDVLSIESPALLIDGKVADQNVAFRKNAEQIDGYHGYFNDGKNMRYLTPGTSYEMPNNEFFALGDNSGNSLDSRYWGSFDEKAVIGRALFIYYPFTKRWGIAD